MLASLIAAATGRKRQEGMMMSWTDERIEQLQKLWMRGMTASQIADELAGVSRNAVIGKAHRLGLQSRPSPVKPNEPPPAKTRGKQAQREPEERASEDDVDMSEAEAAPQP